MASFNTKYMINEYVTDFGITIKNLGVKIQTGAPKIANIYQERTGGTCGGGFDFKPRRLEAIFEDGRRLLYPVESIAKIQEIGATLMPSVLDGAIPGDAEDEAICLNLLGEEWGMIPPSIAVANQTTLYAVVKGSIKKQSVTYNYISDITELGTIKLSFNFQTNWVAEVITCQKKGITPLTGSQICTAGAGISPRKLIMSTAYTNDQSYRGRSTGSRDVPVADSSKLATVANDIKNCSRCIAYVGETIPNVQLFLKQKVV